MTLVNPQSPTEVLAHSLRAWHAPAPFQGEGWEGLVFQVCGYYPSVSFETLMRIARALKIDLEKDAVVRIDY